jgi:hypothetical protein
LAKFISQRKQNKDEWFNSVVKNAFLFLKQSVNNLDEIPRSSIIDLYTAIELLFKARLMKEHWSLILTKPEDADITRFENGDFHSVYLEQSEKRLKNICKESFKLEAMNNFKALGEHRNQIVHFAHTGFSNNSDELVIEHWGAWFYLHDLLKTKWYAIFSDFQSAFDSLHTKMQNRKGFLNVKFDAVFNLIEIEKKKGNEVKTCPSCSFDGALITQENYWGDDFHCMVCDVKDEIPKVLDVTIECEHCGVDVSYFMLEEHKCYSCKRSISRNYALDEYTKIYRSDYGYSEEEDRVAIEDGVVFDDADSLYPIGFCHNCKADKPSVVKVGSLDICVFCEVRGWRILFCDSCDNHVTGDPDKIKYFACHLCEDEVRAQYNKEMEEFEAEMEDKI